MKARASLIVTIKLFHSNLKSSMEMLCFGRRCLAEWNKFLFHPRCKTEEKSAIAVQRFLARRYLKDSSSERLRP